MEDNQVQEEVQEDIQPIWAEEEEPVAQAYPDEDLEPDLADPEPPVWSERNARQHSAKVAMADGEGLQSDSIDRMAKDLQSTGVSSELNERMAKIAKSKQEAKLKAAGSLTNELGVEQATTLFSAPDTKADQDPVQDLNDQALVNFVTALSEKTNNELVMEDIDTEAGYLAELQGEMAKAQKWEGSRIGDLIDIGGGLIPFNEQNTMRKLTSALEEEFGVESGGTNTFTMGSNKSFMRDQITAMSRREQLDVFKFVDRYLRDNSGIISANDMLRTSIFQELFAGATGEYINGDMDTDKYINNAVSVLDLIGLGGGVKALLKSGSKTIRATQTSSVAADSALASSERVSPKNSAKLKGVAILDETENSATELGTTKAEILSDMLPKQKIEDNPVFVRGASSEFNERQIDIYQKIMADVNIKPHLKEAEITKQMESMITKLENTKDLALWKNGSSITMTEKGLDVTGLLGETAFKGFTDKVVALDRLQAIQKKTPNIKYKLVEQDYSGVGKYDNVPNAPAENVVKSAREKAIEVVEQSATSRLVRATKAKAIAKAELDELGDVDDVVRFKAQKKVQKADERIAKANSDIDAVRANKVEDLSATGSKQLIDRTDITFSKEGPKQYFIEASVSQPYANKGTHLGNTWETEIFGRGSKAEYLGDINTNLHPRLAKSLLSANNMFEHKQKLFFDMLNPLLKANTKVKKFAHQLLQEGSDQGKRFTPDEIRARFMDGSSIKDVNATIEAYSSTRNLFDTMFELENEVHRAGHKALGNMHVQISDEFQALAKPVDLRTAQLNATHLYNPATGKIEKFSVHQVADMYKNGSQIVKSSELHGVTSKTEFVIVKDPSTQIKPLPTKTLSKIEGYIPRIYDEKVFITARPKEQWINGKLLTNANEIPSRAVAVASSAKRAKANLAEIQAKYPDMVIDYKVDRQLTEAQSNQAQSELASFTGRLFYGKRGDHLHDVQGQMADTQDIMYSVQAGASSLARKLDLEPVVDLHRSRWLNDFGRFTGHKYPDRASDIKNVDGKSAEEVGAAKAYFNQIQMTTNSSQDMQKWKTWMFNIGEWMDRKDLPEIAGDVMRSEILGKASPLNIIRTSAFVPMIVLNPMRQLFINTLQPLFLSGLDPLYITTGLAHKQGLPLFKAAITKPTKAQAKIAGIPFNEFKALVEDFKDSGILDSVSNHAFIRDSFSNLEKQVSGNAILATAQKGINAVKKGADISSKVGFEAGEGINRSITYMIARRRMAKKGVDVNSKAGKLAVAQETDNLAQSMGQPGAFRYQQGIFSPALQFFSIQHKMLLSSFSRALTGHGNRNLTRGEATKLAIGQVILYGGAGMGINSIIDEVVGEMGIELDEKEKQLLYGGAFDFTVNAMLSIVSEEDQDIAFSSNIAGGGGFGEMMGDYIKSLLTLEKSPLEMALGPSLTSFGRFATAGRMISKLAGNADYEADGLDAESALTSVLQISSGGNNYIKGKMGERYGQWVDKNFAGGGIDATSLELSVFKYLGISGYKYSDSFKTFTSEKDVMKSLDEDATRLAGDIMREVSLAKTNPEYAEGEALDRFFNKYAMYIDALDEDGATISKMVRNKLSSGLSRTFKDFNQDFAKAVINNSMGSTTEEMILNRVNRGLMDKERGDTLLMIWKKLNGDEE